MAMQVGNGLDLQNQRIQNLGDPSAATDAVTKQYADALTRNLSWKMAVRVATTATGTLATAYENGDTVDGITLATGDRILLKNQSAGAENGIYTVNASGAPTRAVDADTAAELKGATVTVLEGTVNADKVFRLVTDNVTLDTTSLSWTEIGGGGNTYVAGDGLGESPAGTFNVTTGAGLETSGDAVRIAAAAAGAGLTGGAGSALAVGAGTGITVNADDVALSASVAGNGLTHTAGVIDIATGAGLEISSDTVRIAAAAAGNGLTGGAGSALAVGAATGITVAADTVGVDYSVTGSRVAANVGDNSSTSIVVTHSLGTRDVNVQVYRNSTPWDSIICDVERNSTSQVTLKFATAPGTNAYRVVVS